MIYYLHYAISVLSDLVKEEFFPFRWSNYKTYKLWRLIYEETKRRTTNKGKDNYLYSRHLTKRKLRSLNETLTYSIQTRNGEQDTVTNISDKEERGRRKLEQRGT